MTRLWRGYSPRPVKKRILFVFPTAWDRRQLEACRHGWGDRFEPLFAEPSAEAVGYDFGAVDLGVKADGRPVVFEVNSAPGLDDLSVERWGERLLTWGTQLLNAVNEVNDGKDKPRGENAPNRQAAGGTEGNPGRPGRRPAR